MQCPTCNASLLENACFCNVCGAAIRKRRPAPSAVNR